MLYANYTLIKLEKINNNTKLVCYLLETESIKVKEFYEKSNDIITLFPNFCQLEL